ncbi:MAG: iron-containing alcohol dehydrogenase, partial [Marivita sp.]
MTTLPTFGFATATEISFGRGTAHGSIARIATFGRHALIVTGATSDRAGWLIDGLKAAGVATTVFSVPKEPDVNLISAGIAAAEGCDVVIAIGGGAAIDAGKAIAALVPAQGEMIDYLEVVGKGLPLETNPLPFVAIPT